MNAVVLGTLLGGGGTTPRYRHDVNGICRVGLCGQHGLTSLVVASKIHAITQRVESTGEGKVL